MYFTCTENQSITLLRDTPNLSCLKACLLLQGFELQLAELAT